MSKVGRSVSQEVIIELVRMKCLPILLYGTDARPLANKDISLMQHIINCTFGKIFIVKEQEIINDAGSPSNLIISIKLLKIVNSNSLENFLSPITLFVDWSVIFRVFILYYYHYFLFFCHVTIIQYKVYHSLSLFIYPIYIFIMFICSLLWRNKAIYIYIYIYYVYLLPVMA